MNDKNSHTKESRMSQITLEFTYHKKPSADNLAQYKPIAYTICKELLRRGAGVVSLEEVKSLGISYPSEAMDTLMYAKKTGVKIKKICPRTYSFDLTGVDRLVLLKRGYLREAIEAFDNPNKDSK